jgi:hypothetical protein
MAPAERTTAYAELDRLYAVWGARDRNGRPTIRPPANLTEAKRTTYPLSFYAVSGGLTDDAKRARDFVTRRVRVGLLLDVDQPPPAARSRLMLQRRRAQRHAESVLYGPGPWTPDRLRDAGTTCDCQACQQPWPSAEVWWRAHKLAFERQEP